MTTLRDRLQAAYALSAHLCERITSDDEKCPGCLCADEIEAAITQLDESETARRNTGETYRLVPDEVDA